MVALYLLPELQSTLIWSREGMSQQEYWRLISGHFLHSNGYHLLMNLGGVWLMLGLFQPYFHTKKLLLFSLGCLLLISIGIYLWVPATYYYVGLSALLHSWFTYGAVKEWQTGQKMGLLMLIGVIAKVAWENTMGASTELASLIDANVAVEAHLLGVISALLLLLPSTMKAKFKRSSA
ncbi:rhombosortase [Ferrimonas aestuarii]|uniref:Rhombosortase n=2 Tax=Ferrimonas aestuarii TaxID=2569539 RepID=A0A4V5NW16_9GAMM|nr:rhombosortase [Ferrimonas aestuarii]